MVYQTIMSAVERLGFGVAAFALCSWIMMQIVNGLCNTLNTLNTSFVQFSANVQAEHKASELQHESLMEQHQQITRQNAEIEKALGRLNGYK